MVAFLGFMAAITLVLWLAPGSEAGRALHRQLVERPLEALSDIKRHHLIFFVIMAGFAIGGGEAMAMVGPEFVAAYALDLAIYLDAVMVTYALSAVAMARSGGGWFKIAVMWCARRMRPRRKRATRRPAGPRKSANDDDPAPAMRCAA
jgi:hypothetical protein